MGKQKPHAEKPAPVQAEEIPTSDKEVVEMLDHDLEENLEHKDDAQTSMPLDEGVQEPKLTGRDAAPAGSNQSVVDIGAEENN